MAATIIHDSSEGLELCSSRKLFLKPICKMAITVIWPELEEASKSLSNWEVMAKLKQMAHPMQFSSIRVSKSTLDFVRFEAELETQALTKALCQKINGSTLDVQAGDCSLSVLASECNLGFPSSKEWEAFFGKEEERPDTLYLDGLPCKWFSSSGSRSQKPSEEVVREVFQGFGPILNMDIPALDVYREETGSRNTGSFSMTTLQTFDVYLQFQQEEDLRKAWGMLRMSRLMLKESDGKALVCNIKVNIDMTRHLSEAAVQKRHWERRQLEALEEKRQLEKKYEREEEADRKRKEDKRSRRRQEKLKRRAEKQKEEFERSFSATQIEIQDEAKMEEDLWEERKTVLVQRRLQSIRLLTALLYKAQMDKRKENLPSTYHDFSGERRESRAVLRQDTASDIKKTVVCLPDTTKPDVCSDEEPASLPQTLRHAFDYRPMQITISQDNSQRELAQPTRAPADHKAQTTITGKEGSSEKPCTVKLAKREKVYESEEFLNYLLNHYSNPSYARLYQNPRPLSRWQRKVSDDGNGFQISLRNSDGGVCTEVSISQNSSQSNIGSEDHYKWKITIKEREASQRRPANQTRSSEGYNREFEVCWDESSSKPAPDDQQKHLKDPLKRTFTVKECDLMTHGEPKKSQRTDQYEIIDDAFVRENDQLQKGPHDSVELPHYKHIKGAACGSKRWEEVASKKVMSKSQDAEEPGTSTRALSSVKEKKRKVKTDVGDVTGVLKKNKKKKKVKQTDVKAGQQPLEVEPEEPERWKIRSNDVEIHQRDMKQGQSQKSEDMYPQIYFKGDWDNYTWAKELGSITVKRTLVGDAAVTKMKAVSKQ